MTRVSLWRQQQIRTLIFEQFRGIKSSPPSSPCSEGRETKRFRNSLRSWFLFNQLIHIHRQRYVQIYELILFPFRFHVLIYCRSDFPPFLWLFIIKTDYIRNEDEVVGPNDSSNAKSLDQILLPSRLSQKWLIFTTRSYLLVAYLFIFLKIWFPIVVLCSIDMLTLYFLWFVLIKLLEISEWLFIGNIVINHSRGSHLIIICNTRGF